MVVIVRKLNSNAVPMKKHQPRGPTMRVVRAWKVNLGVVQTGSLAQKVKTLRGVKMSRSLDRRHAACRRRLEIVPASLLSTSSTLLMALVRGFGMAVVAAMTTSLIQKLNVEKFAKNLKVKKLVTCRRAQVHARGTTKSGTLTSHATGVTSLTTGAAMVQAIASIVLKNANRYVHLAKVYQLANSQWIRDHAKVILSAGFMTTTQMYVVHSGTVVARETEITIPRNRPAIITAVSQECKKITAGFPSNLETAIINSRVGIMMKAKTSVCPSITLVAVVTKTISTL